MSPTRKYGDGHCLLGKANILSIPLPTRHTEHQVVVSWFIHDNQMAKADLPFDQCGSDKVWKRRRRRRRGPQKIPVGDVPWFRTHFEKFPPTTHHPKRESAELRVQARLVDDRYNSERRLRSHRFLDGRRRMTSCRFPLFSLVEAN